MKKHQVKIVFKDNESLMVSMADNQLEQFLSCIKEGKVYKHPDTEAQFYTDSKDIRYLTSIPCSEEPATEEKSSPDE